MSWGDFAVGTREGLDTHLKHPGSDCCVRIWCRALSFYGRYRNTVAKKERSVDKKLVYEVEQRFSPSLILTAIVQGYLDKNDLNE